MANNNPRFPSLPEDALALLEDPRLAGIKDLKDHPYEQARVLEPAERAGGESRYLLLDGSFEASPDRNALWVNKPKEKFQFLDFGRGMGVAALPERPRIEQATKAPKRLFHLWGFYHSYYIASPDMVTLLRRDDPDSIECIPIEWVFRDGQALDGYQMIDFVRLHHGYDYRRSVVKVTLRDGKKSLELGHDRALREDIPEGIKIYRDASYRFETFVARPLAEEIAALASREISFRDVQTHRGVEFTRPRGRRALQARLKPAQTVADNESMPLSRRMGLRVLPLLQDGKFVEAEEILKQWLLARPASPFQLITELVVTTPLQTVASYFDRFAKGCDRGLNAVYAEMNGFTINPDQWFCSAFGFDEHGGHDGYDWLSDFHSSEGARLVITGLEPLQEMYAHRKYRKPQVDDDADTLFLAEALVIVKFQHLLQRALPLMTSLKCPLLASAHDYDDFTVEIRPGG